MEVDFVVGDWSRDGHGRTVSTRAQVNGVSTTREVVAAHDLGAIKLGIDMSRIGVHMDDHQPTMQERHALFDAGYKYSEMDIEDESWVLDEHYWMDAYGLIDIYLFLASIGNPSITYLMGYDKDVDLININAYGLLAQKGTRMEIEEGHITDTWIPHERETWTAHYGDLVEPLTMQHYKGYQRDGKPVMREVQCEKGQRVRIVMFSRFGDVGITEDLESETGYGARVEIEALKNLSMTKE